MADEAPTTEEAPDTEAPEAAPTVDPKDLVAEVEKWKAHARKHEAQAKANAEAAEKIQALEDAQKSETEKLTDKVARAEAKASALEVANARLQVALEKGLSAEQMEFLTGDTVEELSERADKLLALLKTEPEEEPEEEAPAPALVPAPATPKPKLKSGGAGSYPIGDDDALTRDLKRKVGIS